MSEETKRFIFGLEQCRQAGGMVWHGPVPAEIKELFGVKFAELSHGERVAGVYVEVAPQYEAKTPEWIEK